VGGPQTLDQPALAQEALKFAWHSRRSRLSVADVNHALQTLDVEVLYGFYRGDTKRYARTAGAADVFYLDDALRRCDGVVYERLPRAPVEVGVLPHWLLVDGVRPNTPENRPYKAVARRSDVPAPVTLPSARGGDGGHLSAVDREGQLARLAPIVKHIVSVEQQEFMRILARVRSPPVLCRPQLMLQPQRCAATCACLLAACACANAASNARRRPQHA